MYPPGTAGILTVARITAGTGLAMAPARVGDPCLRSFARRVKTPSGLAVWV